MELALCLSTRLKAQVGPPDHKNIDRPTFHTFQRWAPGTLRSGQKPEHPLVGPAPWNTNLGLCRPQTQVAVWRPPHQLTRSKWAPGPAPPLSPRGAHTHLQHELTLVTPHKDELSREPVAGAAAAHQEPGGDAHLGAREARQALRGKGLSERAPWPGPRSLAP